MATPLRIGILVDSLLKQQYLTTMVAQSGHKVCFRGLLSLTIDDLPDINNAIDAWVIDTEEDRSDATLPTVSAVQSGGVEIGAACTLDYLLEQVTVPAILSER